MPSRGNKAGKQHGDHNESKKKTLRDYKASMRLRRISATDTQKSDRSKKVKEPLDKSLGTKSAEVKTMSVSPTKRPSPTSSKWSPTRSSGANSPSTPTKTVAEADPLGKSDPELIEDEKLKEKLSVRLNDSSKEKLDIKQLQERPYDELYTAAREPLIQDGAGSNPCSCQAPDEENELRRQCKEKIKELTEKGEIEVKVIDGVNHYFTKDGTLLLKKKCHSGKPRRPVPPVLISTPTPATVKLTWGKPSENGDRPVDNYVIEVQNVLTRNWTKVGAVPGSVDPPEFELIGLQEGDAYMFRVYAQNDKGNSAPTYSEQVAVTHVLDRPNQPRGPLVVTNITSRSVNLSWNEPVKSDLIPVMNYLVEKLEITENCQWMPAEEVADVSESNDVIVCDLKPSTGYMFRVLAVNNSGTSEPLYTDDLVYTTSDLPDQPEGPLQVSLTKKEILLSWAKPKNTDEKPVNKYIIDVQDPQNRTWRQVGEVHGNVDQPVIRITQLHPRKELYFRVFAQNIAGKSDPLNSFSKNVKDKKKASMKAPCNCKAEKDNLAPIGPLKVNNKTATSLIISWKEPAPPCNNKVKKYLVEKLDLKTGIWKKVASKQSNENLDLLIENLNPKSSYIFRVVASDGVRSSAPLITKRPIVLSKDEEAPDPNVVIVSDITTNQLKLSWNKFEQNENMVPFKHYAIEKMDISEGLWSLVGCCSPEEDFPEFIVTNLHPGSNYLFRVSSENFSLSLISEKVVQTDPEKYPKCSCHDK